MNDRDVSLDSVWRSLIGVEYLSAAPPPRRRLSAAGRRQLLATVAAVASFAVAQSAGLTGDALLAAIAWPYVALAAWLTLRP